MTSAHKQAGYRVDIDGLRAFAVLPVILFHAGVQAMSGGFVGVDIFFVISGYLITGTLLADGSIINFYQRRARRILPALLTVLALTMVAGLVLFLPHDLEELARSTLATLGFASNIFFWRSAGYFAVETELWPLLHTWSLGVEEQFYIVFPLVLLVIKRLPRAWLTVAIALLALASFVLCVVAMQQLKAVLAFYLAPTRAWELLVGSLLAVRAVPALASKPLRTAVAAAGLVALLVPVFTYLPGQTFPGWLAVPPVLGAAAVIWAGQDGDHHLVPLLGCPPLRFVGLISYSLYLWHWPVLAFARYVAVDPISLTQGLAAIAVAFVLATLSWRFVERPFRRGFSNRAIWLMSAGGILAVGALAGVALAGRGFPQRFPPAVAALNSEQGSTWRCPLSSLVRFGSYYACPIALPSHDPRDAQVVLWGDSHAQMYVPALLGALGDRTALLVNANGCAPLVGEGKNRNCAAIQNRNHDEIVSLPHVDTVILAQNWPQYRNELARSLGRPVIADEAYAPAVARLRRLVADLRGRGKRVLIVLPVPLPGYQLASVASRDMVYRGGVRTRLGMPYETYRSEYANVLAAMDALAAADPQVRLVRVDKVACPDGGLCSYLRDGHAIFSDQGHYAATFAPAFAPLFKDALDATGR